jgi:hypothetical protein
MNSEQPQANAPMPGFRNLLRSHIRPKEFSLRPVVSRSVEQCAIQSGLRIQHRVISYCGDSPLIEQREAIYPCK